MGQLQIFQNDSEQKKRTLAECQVLLDLAIWSHYSFQLGLRKYPLKSKRSLERLLLGGCREQEQKILLPQPKYVPKSLCLKNLKLQFVAFQNLQKYLKEDEVSPGVYFTPEKSR